MSTGLRACYVMSPQIPRVPLELKESLNRGTVVTCEVQREAKVQIWLEKMAHKNLVPS